MEELEEVVFKIGDSAFVGDRKSQRVLFDRTVAETWEPLWGMGREYTHSKSTCFVTTQAGMIQTVLMAMTGIRFDPENWTKYQACLPQGWSRIQVDRIYLGGKSYGLDATDGAKASLTPLVE